MRHDSILSALLVASMLTGCAGVFSPQPVGEAPLALVADEWEGTWTDSRDFLEIRVIDAASGRLEAAWIEASANGFELERIEVLVRASGEALFGNALDEDRSDAAGAGKAPHRYAFFRMARAEGKIVIWWPRLESFARLVEEGGLPGTVTEEGDVVLGELSKEHLSLLAGDEGAALFEWDEPGVLFRPSGD
jgi:hypothetical protein